MSDLTTRLAALRDGTGPVDDSAVAADLRRGRAAFVARRRRRYAAGGLGCAAVVTVGAVSYAVRGNDTPRPAPVAASTTAVPTSPSTTAPPRPSVSITHSPSSTAAIALVAYRGEQLAGYTVARIPAGYVLQGISGSVLDVAKAGDHSPLDTFTGKLVVMLNDHAGPTDGTKVTVNGHPGNLANSDGVQTLTYADGQYNVAVQSWSDIDITSAQLVQFAEGVTVLPSAQVGHG